MMKAKREFHIKRAYLHAKIFLYAVKINFEVKKENEKRELEQMKDRDKTPVQKLFDSVYSKLRG